MTILRPNGLSEREAPQTKFWALKINCIHTIIYVKHILNNANNGK